MIADIIQIGNSKGIRIPKSILELCGFANQVSIHTQGKKLIIEPISPRDGWDIIFKEQAKQESVDFITNEWDEQEWKW